MLPPATSKRFVLRLFISLKYVTANVVDRRSGRVVMTASSVEKALKEGVECGRTCNSKAAAAVGEVLAMRLKVDGLAQEPIHADADKEVEKKGFKNRTKEKWNSAVVILITPSPIDEDDSLRNPYGDNRSGLPERTNEAEGAYAKACVAVAKELGVPVIDIWTKMQQFPDWEKSFLRDGLHFTPCGNRVLFEEVVEKLRDEGLSPEKMAVDLPFFCYIDPNYPLRTFCS